MHTVYIDISGMSLIVHIVIRMHAYIYIYIYMYMYVYICMCIYIYIRVYAGISYLCVSLFFVRTCICLVLLQSSGGPVRTTSKVLSSLFLNPESRTKPVQGLGFRV